MPGVRTKRMDLGQALIEFEKTLVVFLFVRLHTGVGVEVDGGGDVGDDAGPNGSNQFTKSQAAKDDKSPKGFINGLMKDTVDELRLLRRQRLHRDRSICDLVYYLSKF